MEQSSAPDRLPQSQTPPVCWKADYAGEGDVSVWACDYRAEAGAFDAAQRMPAGANEVKFQKGQYLVVVRWNNVSHGGITALVSSLQRTLPGKY